MSPHTAVAWNRKIGAGTLLEKSGATDMQEKLLYPGAGGELKALLWAVLLTNFCHCRQSC